MPRQHPGSEQLARGVPSPPLYAPWSALVGADELGGRQHMPFDRPFEFGFGRPGRRGGRGGRGGQGRQKAAMIVPTLGRSEEMAPIVESIEIARPPEEVASYMSDVAKLPDWNQSAVSARQADSGEPAVGSRIVVTRRVGGRELPMTSEVTELDPPGKLSLRGLDGPVRALVQVTVDPLDGGQRSRVTISLDFEGHGMGKLLVPLVVRRQARRELPGDLRQLKARVEAQGPEPSRAG
jgi:uncharacterized membrane protein